MEETKVTETAAAAEVKPVKQPKPKRKKKVKGVESLKSRYGRMFVLPWEIGLILFFIVPLIKSITYCFSDVLLTANGIQQTFAGLKWFDYLLVQEPGYLGVLTTTLTWFMTEWPIIIVLSLILAIILNQKFKGRLLARAIFFLPVIIASGIVITKLSEGTGMNLSATTGGSGDTYGNMIDLTGILNNLGLPPDVNKLMQTYIGSIFSIVWECGVQIILFIAGLQSIPDTMYEVSKVEGASKWEEFWFITFPMLGQTILLVLVYTLIELITKKDHLMSWAFNIMSDQAVYDRTSAMIWIYFVVSGAIMGIILLLYNKLLLKKWN